MKILLVEDDPGIGRVVCDGLRAHAYDVEWLREGAQAITLLNSNSYSAVILDLMLPDKNGYDLCRNLRGHGIETPIIMLTARDGLDDKLEGFRAGADDYLTKPFSVEELIARIRAVLKRTSKPVQQTRIAYGGLEIDLLAHEVRKGHSTLNLTQREFDVLVCLARNSGHVVSRERLLQSAWGSDADITPNAIDVYVSYLRRKLKAAGERPAIVTVRGVGFRLV